ncbi:MAG: hypothetical protein AAB920_01125 [Patescibacteria group bacterium]
MWKRTIIAVGILLVGVVGASWLVFGNKTNTGSIDISISGVSGGNDARFADLTNSVADNNTSRNVTDDAARAYGLEILKLNPQGMGTDKQVAVPSDVVLNDIVKKATSKPIPVSYFTEKDIKILNVSSNSAVKTYLRTLTSADEKNMTAISDFYEVLGNFVTGGDSQRLVNITNSISSYISILLAMPVPKSLADFHLTLLNFWQAKLTYAQAFLNKENDPLYAATASQSLSALLSQEKGIQLDFINRSRGIIF